MGRGRQKAKHTKVARDLKYFSPDTNYGALARELSGSESAAPVSEDSEKWPEYSAGSSYSDEYDVEEDDEDDEETRSA
ncbi:DUF3073 domain-containing protein [Salinibacterium sp. NG253]|uniref:DUF3073 domain-containing protein n=1 Tax=unclassified Salinibacterium TaxID=2632331 RepID=UPI0018CFBE49|nr:MULTISPECIES: DUF3073 domain-containing protein [unclassified Salinibacterium]MBH0023053.1 DUF3073 domain-containing protein [Salinibacterium sp. SWN248]MBH0109917.1 DUF3073 domain-containing protein [Salinibacterium sp. NG22]MBH0116620.1 DUF3073 domain-containing protein [Salinibacterium sp. NG253]